MSDKQTIEGLLREVAPQALAVLARRSGSFADAEDAVQEALIKAYQTWRDSALPERPLAWLVRVASGSSSATTAPTAPDAAGNISRRLVAAGHRRAGSWPRRQPHAAVMCCHDALTAAATIALTLRALGGLTTRS